MLNIHQKGFFEDYHFQTMKEEIVTQGIHDFPKLEKLSSEGMEANPGLPDAKPSFPAPHWTCSHAFNYLISWINPTLISC